MPAPSLAALRLRLALPIVLVASIQAADPYGTTPVLVQLGATYLSQEMRAALGSDWGIHTGVAAKLDDSGLFGMPSADLDLRYASGNGSSFMAFGTTYAERRLIDEHWWLGMGAGADYIRVQQDVPANAAKGTAAINVDERKWAIGGKAMLGFLITPRFFLEGTYHYSHKVAEIDTTSISIGLGYWF